MLSSWLQGNNWSEENVGTRVYSDYGFVHIYALTMTLGVILSIAGCAVQFYRKKLNFRELWIAAVIVVPVGLLGASFFGKLNAQNGSNADGVGFFGLFAFWKAGMSIHGAIFSTVTVGIIMFNIVSVRNKVSVWVYADSIAPNVLLGQVIGRWGNFFNHELFGKPAGLYEDKNVMSWLPAFIRDNMAFRYTGSSTNDLIQGQVYVMHPIFLYESFFLLVSWLIITLVLPFIGRWIGKKPWKLNPEKYSFDIKYSYKYFFTRKKEEGKKTYWDVWEEATSLNFEEKQKDRYIKEIDNINDKNPIIRRFKKGKLLIDTNNPNKYLLTRSGVEFGGYFFAWNFIRFMLELDRPDDHLFIMYQKTLSLTLIGLTAFSGLVIIFLTQWILPYFIRKPGYIYEQHYFYVNNVKDKSENKHIVKNTEPNPKVLKAQEKLKKQLEKKNK
ncbi:prolipoprotein diacylglyceryl transferase [Spiroplasma turonicum]|uniref:Prolipoprotein diacylglyceryl transferase n=1 Tax=Spiroplasma turonicum TaxID=216946 RepID=A0A0K1P4V2_9MOLU|nr:prolipoprotein diacylglyceryl transferase family protein [Spiroplasma turonicum]AKU79313.1 prolipoprotein diacylglyceryl transferase [Spiroplasma turonicum]ALX70336.1 prolipoprotein diacylglyceryl transferase [Spiroplasma turonicum]